MTTSTVGSRMIGIQKVTLNNAFDTVALVQDQTGSAMKIMMNQMPAISDKGWAMVDEWTDAFRERRGFYREAMNAFMERIEDVYGQEGGSSEAPTGGINSKTPKN